MIEHENLGEVEGGQITSEIVVAPSGDRIVAIGERDVIIAAIEVLENGCWGSKVPRLGDGRRRSFGTRYGWAGGYDSALLVSRRRLRKGGTQPW